MATVSGNVFNKMREKGSDSIKNIKNQVASKGGLAIFIILALISIAVLIAWTLVMLVWMLSTRLPAMRASGVDITKLVGTKAADADGRLPPALGATVGFLPLILALVYVAGER